MTWLTNIFMAATLTVADGDAAFYRVDTRTPAHELPAGVCADAGNKRFEDGRAWPRFNLEAAPWGELPVPAGTTVLGFARFNDPQGLDVLVAATDDWRTGAGEDGGRGRIWKLMAGNAPHAVPLNGNDVYGAVRFIPCFNALVLLRQENERHYFSAAAVGAPAANAIQLNCAPDWTSGDLVYLWGEADSSFTGAGAPAAQTFAFVNNLGNNVVELYNDPALTAQIHFTGAVGRFYLERRAATPGPFGNGAGPLMAQPNAAGNTLWETGFAEVPVNLAVTSTAAATSVWTVPNHRLNPGDGITLANMPAGHTPADGNYFAYPLNDHQLQLFATQTEALLAANGSTAGLIAISNDHETVPTMVKQGASGLPMPAATEGFYTENNRLVLVNGNSLLISDPLDPLHYTPMSASLTADLGESDTVTAVSSFIAGDCLVIGKQKSILALYNFSGGPAAWTLRSVTREYGCIAPLSMRQWGNQLMFLSRRGLDSVELSAFGVIVPTVKPVSFDMHRYVNRIDWNAGAASVVETWSNRLFWSVKLKGQPGDQNNALLVLNFLNSDLRKQIFGWEGCWTGAGLQAVGLAKHTIAGEERLALLNLAGGVGWLGDGTLDQPGNVPIADQLTTRVYTGAGQGMNRKVFTQALCVWDSNNALLTVTAVTPGWNENTVLTPAGGLAYNPRAYGAGPNTSYDPATQQPPFNTPLREDYALQAVTEIIGGVPDALQNHSEPFRMRQDDWGVQLIIANARGQCRLAAVSVAGFVGPSSDRARV